MFHLEAVDLSSNDLEGGFPGFIKDSLHVEHINIGGNRFEGVLPLKMER